MQTGRGRGLTVLGAALLAASLLAACGGGSKDEDLQFDPAKAEVIAHNALIPASALPGEGWRITDEGPKESDEEPPSDSAACKQVKAFQAEVKAADEKSRAARAKRELSRDDPQAPLPVSVEVEIEIYRETGALDRQLRRVRELVGGDVYGTCFGELMTSLLKERNLTSNTKSVTTLGPAPANGFTFAAESEVTGLNAPLRFENYGWIEGNAKITISISGSRSSMTPDLARAAIEKTQAALKLASP